MIKELQPFPNNFTFMLSETVGCIKRSFRFDLPPAKTLGLPLDHDLYYITFLSICTAADAMRTHHASVSPTPTSTVSITP
jgi:hypothetical protein